MNIMNSEIWKVIPGYENYQVSNLGRVKSDNKNGEIKISYLSNGYNYQTLYNEGKKRNFRVSQLVAMAFLGHIPNKFNKVVDHIDNDKTNDTLQNLQIITNRENSSKDKKNKSSLYTGVYFDNGKYRSDIIINGKREYLGRFDCEIDAHNAYVNKLRESKHI